MTSVFLFASVAVFLFVSAAFADGWAEQIKNATSAAHKIAVALSVVAGLKVFTAYAWGGRQADSESIMKWAVGFFVVITFTALTGWIKSQIGV